MMDVKIEVADVVSSEEKDERVSIIVTPTRTIRTLMINLAISVSLLILKFGNELCAH